MDSKQYAFGAQENAGDENISECLPCPEI